MPGAAAKSRVSMVEALAAVLPALVADVAGMPGVDLLRRALTQFGLPPSVRQLERPREMAAALRWLDRASVPMTQLAEAATGAGWA